MGRRPAPRGCEAAMSTAAVPPPTANRRPRCAVACNLVTVLFLMHLFGGDSAVFRKIQCVQRQLFCVRKLRRKRTGKTRRRGSVQENAEMKE